MDSFWSLLPLDLIYKEMDYLNSKKHFESFAGDSHIKKKYWENDDFWQNLFIQKFSSNIKLRKNETIKSQYINDIEEWFKVNKQKKIEKILKFCTKRGYEKLFFSYIDQKHIDFSQILISYPSRLGFLGQLMQDSCKIENLTLIKYLHKFSPKTNSIEFKTYDHVNHSEIVHIMLNGLNAEHVLSYGIDFKNINVVKYAVEEMGCRKNYITNINICEAVRSNSLTIVQYLHQNGSDIHINNEEPLVIAVIHKRISIIQYLIDNKANINVAIRHAREYDRKSAISVLEKILQSSNKNIKLNENKQSTCQAKNKSGNPCSRKSTNGSNFCWQHC